MSSHLRPQSYTSVTTQNLNVTTHADVGNIRISGTIRVKKDPAKNGHVLTLNKDGSTEWKEIDTQPFFTNKQSKQKDDPTICYNKGSVGIGVRKPRDLLHVGNDIRVDGVAKVEGMHFLNPDTFLNKQQTFNICTKKENVFQISNKNNIGICHENPDERLVVNGNVKLTGNLVHKSNQFAFPKQSDVLVGAYQSQTLHNKRMDTPTLVSPAIRNPTISGKVELDGMSCISNVKKPILIKDVATKEYVDTLFESQPFSYGEDVIRTLSNLQDREQYNEPGRYLIEVEKKTMGDGNQGHDSELSKENGCIAEWDGLEWTFQKPPDKHIVFVNSINSRIIYVSELGKWVTYSSTETFHSELEHLLHDDHPQYTLSSGRPGGQILTGGTTPVDSLTLIGTSFRGDDSNTLNNQTSYKRDYRNGCILLNPSEGCGGVGIGCNSPDEALHVDGNMKVTGGLVDSTGVTYNLPSHNPLPDGDSESCARLVSENSIDDLRNKTLVSPILSGCIQNLCYKVDSIMKSQDLNDHHILFIMAKSAITLSLPSASLYPGKQYVIRMLKKGVCNLVVSHDNRIDQNGKKYTINPDVKVTTLISDGISRWYTM